MTKQKRKNNETQNILVRWFHTYLRSIKNDIYSYRFVYSMPLIIGVLMVMIPVLSIEQRLAYIQSDYVFLPFVRLHIEALMSLILLAYFALGLCWLIIILIRATALFLVLLVTLPITSMIWFLPLIFLSPYIAVDMRESIHIDSHNYHILAVANVVDIDSHYSHYDHFLAAYKCDSANLFCETIETYDLYLWKSRLAYPDYQFVVKDNQLVVTQPYRGSVEVIMVIEDDLVSISP